MPPLLFVTVKAGVTTRSVSSLVQFAGVLGLAAVQPPPPTFARLVVFVPASPVTVAVTV